MIGFISGGARSGKSHFAEEKALSLFYKNEKSNLFYIATAKKTDKEMKERIRIHRLQRGGEWQTFEESFDILPILTSCKKNDVVLLDCLTIWLSNVMFEREYGLNQMGAIVESWLKFAQENEIHLLIVSNDVNEGLPFSDKAVQSYIYSLQQLHQRLVQKSDLVVQVQGGIPLYWKGEAK